jgi:hypothetical protein
MEIDSETIPPPPSVMHRETNIILDERQLHLIQFLQQIQFPQETYLETSQLDIKYLLGLEKL